VRNDIKRFIGKQCKLSTKRKQEKLGVSISNYISIARKFPSLIWDDVEH
jgi:hypothetical protein